MNDFTDAEIANLDAGLENLLEAATPVVARVHKTGSVVYSLRIEPKELDEFYAAARERGISLSEFMRSATRAAIQGNLDLEKASALGEVKEKARELNQAIERLTA
jgi:hypothetical protein